MFANVWLIPADRQILVTAQACAERSRTIDTVPLTLIYAEEGLDGLETAVLDYPAACYAGRFPSWKTALTAAHHKAAESGCRLVTDPRLPLEWA